MVAVRTRAPLQEETGAYDLSRIRFTPLTAEAVFQPHSDTRAVASLHDLNNFLLLVFPGARAETLRLAEQTSGLYNAGEKHGEALRRWATESPEDCDPREADKHTPLYLSKTPREFQADVIYALRRANVDDATLAGYERLKREHGLSPDESRELFRALKPAYLALRAAGYSDIDLLE